VGIRWNDDSIARALDKDAELHPVATAHTVVPPNAGFYSIFVDKPESLPTPFDRYLREKGTRLIYIGVASQSLFERLIEQDLRHRKASTFFRGIGAILEYRPPAGSLVGKRNQNNYKFSKPDTLAIDAWCREHLAVRFVIVDTGQHPNAERHAIGRSCPILNTTHNPECLSEVAELRELCRHVGRTATA
jgi:hypothetical protein